MMKEGDYIQEILLKEDNYLPPHSQPRQTLANFTLRTSHFFATK